MQLPPRLSAIAGFVPSGKRIVDIGTDHALLPVHLLQQGICPGAVAGDVSAGPYEVAREAIAAAGLAEQIAVRQGDGLAVVGPGEVQVAVIAGMGGGTIRDILAAGIDQAAAMERLILQPMVDAGALRLWLVTKGWRLAEETLVEENGVIYEIIVAERGREEETDPLLVEIGPRLIERRDPLLKKTLAHQISSLKRIIFNLAKSTSPEALHKKTELLAKLGEMKKVTAWL